MILVDNFTFHFYLEVEEVKGSVTIRKIWPGKK